MSDPMTDFEARLASAVQAYLDRAPLTASAESVVANVLAKSAAPQRAARQFAVAGLAASLAVLVLTALVIGPRLLERGASWPDMATVGGSEYHVGVGRGLIVAHEQLIGHGPITASSYAPLVGATAYQLPYVEPSEALVTLHRGRFDDQPGAGPYAILWGGPEQMRQPSDALCAYFASGEAPSSCPAREAIQLLPDEPLPPPYDWDGIQRALSGRGFELALLTPAESVGPFVAVENVIGQVEEAIAHSGEPARIVSVHLAAVTFHNVRIGDLEREPMYIVESTGYRTGNCFTLIAASPSVERTIGACFYPERRAPAPPRSSAGPSNPLPTGSGMP